MVALFAAEGGRPGGALSAADAVSATLPPAWRRLSRSPPLLPPTFPSRFAQVLHGADSDVIWLQRDFGLYLVGVFDTGQAARLLEMPSFALAHLLKTYCGVVANKAMQIADWRIRTPRRQAALEAVHALFTPHACPPHGVNGLPSARCERAQARCPKRCSRTRARTRTTCSTFTTG